MQYRNYTNQDIINKSKEVKSIAGLLRKLGLRPVGGNYGTMKRKLQQLSVDTLHWTGQGWSIGERLKDWASYTKPKHLKKHLMKIRGHKCEQCKLEAWLSLPITIELHHINGNRTDNSSENLMLLCPNCHAQTENWRGRSN